MFAWKVMQFPIHALATWHAFAIIKLYLIEKVWISGALYVKCSSTYFFHLAVCHFCCLNPSFHHMLDKVERSVMQKLRNVFIISSMCWAGFDIFMNVPEKCILITFIVPFSIWSKLTRLTQNWMIFCEGYWLEIDLCLFSKSTSS